jgi:predicted transcriptional regulator/DNA-binding XRE family transcriptional regulator
MRLGAKVRALRRKVGLTQADMARRLDISPSYMNLIENDHRPLTAPLLIRLASEFDVDVASFAADEDSRLIADMMEVFGDPMFDELGVTNAEVRELVAATPGLARAIDVLYRGYTQASESARSLAQRFDGPLAQVGVDAPLLPSEEVSDLLERSHNHFPRLEDAAESLWREAELDDDRLQDGLVRYLNRRLDVKVEVIRAKDGGGRTFRRFDPDKRELSLSEVLPPRSRNFQLAHQIALLKHRELLDTVAADKGLTTEDSRKLCRVALANYFASAVLMPYEPFLRAAREARYDVELLGHRFRTSFEQVCHRLTTLKRPGHEGLPFHFIRVDVAGNISKRFAGSGIRFARFSGACPKWNVFTAFATPGLIRRQLSVMPDGARYLCVARTVRSAVGGFHAGGAVYAVGLGCRVEHASELIYSEGLDLDSPQAARKIGVTCRMCERTDCAQRAMPALHTPLVVDENERGASFYGGAGGATPAGDRR